MNKNLTEVVLPRFDISEVEGLPATGITLKHNLGQCIEQMNAIVIDSYLAEMTTDEQCAEAEALKVRLGKSKIELKAQVAYVVASFSALEELTSTADTLAKKIDDLRAVITAGLNVAKKARIKLMIAASKKKMVDAGKKRQNFIASFHPRLAIVLKDVSMSVKEPTNYGSLLKGLRAKSSIEKAIKGAEAKELVRIFEGSQPFQENCLRLERYLDEVPYTDAEILNPANNLALFITHPAIHFQNYLLGTVTHKLEKMSSEGVEAVEIDVSKEGQIEFSEEQILFLKKHVEFKGKTTIVLRFTLPNSNQLSGVEEIYVRQGGEIYG